MSLDTKFKCPSCRREHQIDHARLEPAVCSRCACDLEVLVLIRISADAMLNQAWQALRCQDDTAAIQYAERAWGLIESKEIAHCGMIASVLTQDPAKIDKWQMRTTTQCG